MTVDTSFVGRVGGRARVVIERGPVEKFATAVKDRTHVVDGGVAPSPTYLIAAGYWGSLAELQPDEPGDDPIVGVIRGWLRDGGLLLHGEQSFEYHRPVRVGDALDLEIEVTEMYEKGSMEFAVAETRYTDAASGEPVVTASSTYVNRRR